MYDAKDKEQNESIANILDNILLGKIFQYAQRSPDDYSGEEYKSLIKLCKMLDELNRFTDQIANGDFSIQLPAKDNYLAAGIKNVHARLAHLVWQINQVAQGDYNQTFDYMGELSEGFNWMTHQLQLRKIQMDYELNHDVSTGLINRSAFLRLIESKVTNNQKKIGCLLYFGLDNLKYVNNTYEHEIGDQYIKAAAAVLNKFSEIKGTAAHISGNEFAVYIHEYDSRQDAWDHIEIFINEKIKNNVFSINGIDLKIRISTGAAMFPDDAKTAAQLIRYASHAMYTVKKSNPGAILQFDSISYQAKSYMKQEPLAALIEARNIQFAFQPIINLHNGTIYGYEALMRSLDSNFSSPFEIIDTAQAHSMLYQLEKMTVVVLFEWMAGNYKLLGKKKIFFNTLSGNVYKKNSLEDISPNFSDYIPNIVFEILESAVDIDNTTFIDDMNAIRSEFGLKVAIDDYGCGYSNDYRLLNIAPDILKIDKFFITEIDKNMDKQAILSNIISFCSTRNIKILAEGIETSGELKTVVRLGVDYAQGFYLGKPSIELQPFASDLSESIQDFR